jgi:type VI secretion system protein ImpH
MGDYGWGKEKRSVIEWLFAEGYRFDFFQAVRLLETLYAWELTSREDDEAKPLTTRASVETTRGSSVPLVELVEAAKDEAPKDFVRFKSAVALNFPTSDISKVELLGPPSNGGPKPLDEPTTEMIVERARQGNGTVAEMTVNLMGLAGALGPLDMPTTELIIERVAKHDTALKDFLDIFNHRLISLLYRIRKVHHIGLEHEPPGQDQISKYLFSIIGMDTDGLLGRMQIRDRSLLHYAGLLGLEQRSLVGLELILADYFKVKVRGRQFAGEWYDLDETQWTKIGATGQNQRLGHEAVVLGKHVWDEQAKIELDLGPLSLERFYDFIPTGWGFQALCDLTRFYLGDTLDVSFRLTMKGAEIPAPMLSATDGPRLGWTSWLKAARDDSQAEIDLSAPHSEFKSDRLPLFFHLPAEQLAQLIGMMKVRSYSKSQTIMRQGKPGQSMFAIERGSVLMIRRWKNGRLKTLHILGHGECFGEMSLLLGKHREATAIALEDCEILELEKRDFEEFSARSSQPRDASFDDRQVEINLSARQSEFKSDKLPLFFHLPPAQLAELIGIMKRHVHPYSKSQTIMRQGEPGQSMFAISRGHVELNRRESNGKLTMLGTLGQGECFGEMSLLLGKHREATAIALEDCEILELKKKNFEEFSARNQQWRKALKAYRFGQLVKAQQPNRKFLS